MLTLRKAEDRGHTDLGWLNSYHTFSFGSYHDPKHMGFRSLRVLNDDRVAAGKGFGAHGHRDMEILSYVLEGGLAHKDSMGEQHVLGPNEVQAMSAGSGVIHSEFNASATAATHFLQIWIVPSVEDLRPSYQQFAYAPSEKRGTLRLIAGPDKSATPPAAFINQDARMYAAVLGTRDSIDYAIRPGRHAWVQCATGAIDVNGLTLKEGDGLAVSEEPALTLRGSNGNSELLLFDLA
ncbi:MAG TPA: pirin family protein [Vicinamibacterales bacterium]|jgi:redox-sensitive bicupin YhaK (pirin superfamily)|nr:pirin family protein [Vicinamibacterales bacterium]